MQTCLQQKTCSVHNIIKQSSKIWGLCLWSSQYFHRTLQHWSTWEHFTFCSKRSLYCV